MNERDLWWKIVIVGGLVALAFASVWPIEEKLKFGIDLYGGYSLLYEIDDTGLEGQARADLSKEVMKVLRKRVDPDGVFNLVWRPVGHNRLEIQMPRPSEDVRRARGEYETLQESLRATVLRRSDVLAAVSKDAASRPQALADLAGSIDSRLPLLEEAAKAYDALEAMNKTYEARKTEVEKDNLSEDVVLEAIKKPVDQREAAFQPLIGGISERKGLLEAAAGAWEDYESAQIAKTQPIEGPTLQPDDMFEMDRKRAFEAAIKAVMSANIDPDSPAEGVTLDEVIRLEEVFDEAIGKVIATNIDLGQLQSLLELKKDEKRTQGIQELTEQHPGLSELIQGLDKSTDELQKRRKGEGRLEDPADLQRLLKGAGVLEFRILPQNDPSNPEFAQYRESLRKRGPRPEPGEEEYQWFEIEDPLDFTNLKDLATSFEEKKNSLFHVIESFGDKYYVLAHIGEPYIMVHRQGERDWSLKSAFLDQDSSGFPAVGFKLDQRGGQKFGDLTRRYKGQALCIFLDDQAISSPRIDGVIYDRGVIRGRFTQQEVNDMVKKLNAGSLPKKLKDPPISVRSIGPSLGQANRDAGLRAAIWGATFVAIFMIIYYFYAGGIAVIAVGMNILLIGATMSALGATLTLPGIAGLVLAIGMAVDANVLINERIREELGRGTAMRMAIKLGYERAFRAILDSNVTTILTCVILYMVGSEEVKGFGLTLGIGVFVNIFTAYFVTRMFFELMAMISVPREIMRYPVFVALGITAFGAALFGSGYALIDPANHDTAVSISFGKSIMQIGPAIVGLLILMVLARSIHHGRKSVPMMRLIGVPRVDWVGKRYVFFGVSAVFVVASLAAFASLDRNNLYDIEFLGGTSAQIDLKEAGSLDQTKIGERLEKSGESLEGYGEAIEGAKITGSDGFYTIETPGVPAARLEPVLKVVLNNQLSQVRPIQYDDPSSNSVTIQIRDPEEGEEPIAFDPDQARTELAQRLKRAAESIRSANVQAISGFESGGEEGRSFSIVTREAVKEIVVDAIMETMEDDIDIQPALSFKLRRNRELGDVGYFPIRSEDTKALGFELTDREAAAVSLQGWQGGVALVLDDIVPPQSVEVLQKRLREMRLQPGFEEHGWRQSKVFGLTPASPGSDRYNRVLVTVIDENYPLEDEEGGLSSIWQANMAEPEVALLLAALQRQTSLSQITQFDNQVSGEAQIQAYVALALSWLLIIAYVWFRFGNIRWGLAAVSALIHDVMIALGAVSLTYYLATKVPALGSLLLVNEVFRIDLAMVAAMLTVIGYSVNDTIVVFDRIRENRGRQTDVTAEMVNNSISQTLSRTVLTLLTSLISVLIMYVLGGRGIHGFSYVLLIGLTIGTYSSIGIASQFLLRRRQLAMAAAS
ncbi:MAG: protein translocase subunit SecD [Phycisphaerales bacterium]|nr:protein translocase subunit SecD [Phycisphaerales bacterium]